MLSKLIFDQINFCSEQKHFYKMVQNSQKNTCDRVKNV